MLLSKRLLVLIFCLAETVNSFNPHRNQIPNRHLARRRENSHSSGFNNGHHQGSVLEASGHAFSSEIKSFPDEYWLQQPALELDKFWQAEEIPQKPKQDRKNEDEETCSKSFKHELVLEKERFAIKWVTDQATEVITIQIEVRCKPGDLIGFGFSDYGKMEGADIVIFQDDILTDSYTDSEGRLHLDSSQDYSLDRVRPVDGGLEFTFHRQYDTCDDNDYMLHPGTSHLMFFVAKGPIPGLDGLYLERLKPGMRMAQLLRTPLPEPEFPPDTKTIHVHVKNVEVPAEGTTYWCAVQKLPEMTEKLHIIRFEGAISEAGQGIVHHLEVFHCEVPEEVKVKDYNGHCSKEDRPPGLEACRKVIGAWAMGASGLSYPEEAGYPIGGPGFSRYVLIELHYNNPELKTDIVDSSGLRFYVTPTLRQYEAGVMELGMEYTDKYALPPRQELWSLHGYCTPECTHLALPPQGIKVFASQLHTHSTGRKVSTKHYRNGVELPELNRDDHYSPHFQEIRRLPRIVRVLPGDSLVTTCEDSTIDRPNITMGGFAISEEMCVNYIHYYPRVDLEICKSAPAESALYRFFHFINQYQEERTSPMLGIQANYRAIRWSPMNIALLRTFYDTAPLSMQCNQSDGRRFPGEWEERPIPKVLFPLPPEERPCLQ